MHRSQWLDVWKTMLTTEALLDVAVSRLQFANRNKLARAADRFLVCCQELRYQFEESWESQWGNLTDFQLWARTPSPE